MAFLLNPQPNLPLRCARIVLQCPRDLLQAVRDPFLSSFFSSISSTALFSLSTLTSSLDLQTSCRRHSKPIAALNLLFSSLSISYRCHREKTNADSVVNDKGKEMVRDVSEEGVAVGDLEKSEMEWSGDETDHGEKRGRFTREEKGNAVLVDEDTVVSTNGSDFVDLNLIEIGKWS
ncbi:hypothetical protein QYF36_007702 [Acer negundo]|nr:hypothetical protein QYF36_007702 [Acer negundo]